MAPLGEATGVGADEVGVQRAPLDQQRPERLEQRQITVDLDR
jgi:hypothetical protein